jgi:hypothetical protein
MARSTAIAIFLVTLLATKSFACVGFGAMPLPHGQASCDSCGMQTTLERCNRLLRVKIGSHDFWPNFSF